MRDDLIVKVAYTLFHWMHNLKALLTSFELVLISFRWMSITIFQKWTRLVDSDIYKRLRWRSISFFNAPSIMRLKVGTIVFGDLQNSLSIFDI
jgi:hypothetical protein